MKHGLSSAVMKNIKLPVIRTYSMEPIDLENLPQVEELADGTRVIPLGTMDFSELAPEMKTAAENGGEILYAATSIEKQIDQILLFHFFGPAGSHPEKRSFFDREILQSSALTYAFKKQLVDRVLEKTSSLNGSKRNRLQKLLADVMKWRNAFAHGSLHFAQGRGVEIHFYAGRLQTLLLDDDYWERVENSFSEASSLLGQVL